MAWQARRIEEARQEYRDAAAALGKPFKHDEVLLVVEVALALLGVWVHFGFTAE